MKIKLNLEELGQTIINIIIAILFVFVVALMMANSDLRKINTEIMERYEIVQEEKQELLKMLKEE